MSTIPGVSVTTSVVSSNPRGNITQLIALIGSADSAGAGVAVPQVFSTYSQAAVALGTTTVNGHLIEMIYQAFNNGAAQVLAVVVDATDAGVLADYQAAFDAILTYDGISAVVIEATDPTFTAALEAHINSAATQNRFRRGYVGVPPAYTVSQAAAAALALNSDRMFLSYPNWKNTDATEMLGGITATIAAFAAESETDPSQPVTGKVVHGTNGLFLRLLDTDYDTLHNGGVYTNSDRGGDTVMRYLTTSSDTGTIKEGTISKARDYVAFNLKAMLEGQFRRVKMTSTTVKQIQSATVNQMSKWQTQAIISPDINPTVVAVQDGTDPTKVDLTVTYNAVYPLNFIQLNITLVL